VACGISAVGEPASGDGAGVSETAGGEASAVVDVVGVEVGSGAGVGDSAFE
jgi:hypothetical protein